MPLMSIATARLRLMAVAARHLPSIPGVSRLRTLLATQLIMFTSGSERKCRMIGPFSRFKWVMDYGVQSFMLGQSARDARA